MQKGWISPEFLIKSSKADNTVIIGYASVFEVTDNQNDIISKGAFKNSESHNVRLLWQHDVTKPIGVIKCLEEDEYGLKILRTTQKILLAVILYLKISKCYIYTEVQEVR